MSLVERYQEVPFRWRSIALAALGLVITWQAIPNTFGPSHEEMEDLAKQQTEVRSNATKLEKMRKGLPSLDQKFLDVKLEVQKLGITLPKESEPFLLKTIASVARKTGLKLTMFAPTDSTKIEFSVAGSWRGLHQFQTHMHDLGWAYHVDTLSLRRDHKTKTMHAKFTWSSVTRQKRLAH